MIDVYLDQLQRSVLLISQWRARGKARAVINKWQCYKGVSLDAFKFCGQWAFYNFTLIRFCPYFPNKKRRCKNPLADRTSHFGL